MKAARIFMLLSCFFISRADETPSSYGLEVFIRTKNTYGNTVWFTATLLNSNETRWSSNGWLTTGMQSAVMNIQGDYSGIYKGFDFDSTQASLGFPQLGFATYVLSATSETEGQKHAQIILERNGWYFTGDKWLLYDFESDAFYLTGVAEMTPLQQVSAIETFNTDNPENSKLQPTNPANLTIINCNNHPQLSWDASIPSGSSKYEILRNNVLVHTTGIGETSWIDLDVGINGGANREFDYKVIASNTGVNVIKKYSKGYSNTATVYGIQYQSDKHLSIAKSPGELSIESAYPNPFNPETTLKFSIKEPSLVKIKIYDVVGRLVNDLVNEDYSVGEYRVIFKGESLPSGIYYAVFQISSATTIQKLVFQK